MTGETLRNGQGGVNHKTIPVRTFLIPANDTGDKLEIKITEPAFKADNLALETWASSTVLSSQLHHVPISFPAADHDAGEGKQKIIPIVELGAGTGVVGITAAAIYKQDVVLTDLPPIVPALVSNIELNARDVLAAGSAAGVTVSAGVLDWTSRDTLTVLSPLHVVHENTDTRVHVLLAADTLYSQEHPDLLTRTIEAWLSKHQEARLILGTAMRVAYLDELRELWAKLEDAGLETVWEGKGVAEEKDFDDERLVEVSVWRWRQS